MNTFLCIHCKRKPLTNKTTETPIMTSFLGNSTYWIIFLITNNITWESTGIRIEAYKVFFFKELNEKTN